MTNTTKLGLYLPVGSDYVTRAAHNADMTQIDLAAAAQSQVDQPFHLDAVSYDVTNNRLVLTVNVGRALFPGLTRVVTTAISTVYVSTPTTNTTYTLYLRSDGTFQTTNTGSAIPGTVALWQVTTGVTVSTLTTTDLRGQVVGAATATTVAAINAGSYTPLVTDDIIVGNTASGVVTVNLPPAVGSGRKLWLRKLGAGNALNIVPNGGDQIDEVGPSTLVVPALNLRDGRLLFDYGLGMWRVLARGGDDSATLDGAETLTNKTISGGAVNPSSMIVPVGIATASPSGGVGYNAGKLNYGDGSVTRYLVAEDVAATLTNKTLTSAILAAPVLSTATPTTAGALGYTSGHVTVGDGSANHVVVDRDSAETISGAKSFTARLHASMDFLDGNQGNQVQNVQGAYRTWNVLQLGNGRSENINHHGGGGGTTQGGHVWYDTGDGATFKLLGVLDESGNFTAIGTMTPGAPQINAGAIGYSGGLLSYGDGAGSRPLMAKVAEASLTTSASSIPLAIPGGFRHLRVEFSARCDRAGVLFNDFLVQFNGDGGSNYSAITLATNGSGTLSSESAVGATGLDLGYLMTGALAPANVFGNGAIDIPSYAGTTNQIGVRASGTLVTGSTAASMYATTVSGIWTSTAAITSILFFPALGANFVAGTVFTAYGLP